MISQDWRGERKKQAVLREEPLSLAAEDEQQNWFLQPGLRLGRGQRQESTLALRQGLLLLGVAALSAAGHEDPRASYPYRSLCASCGM